MLNEKFNDLDNMISVTKIYIIVRALNQKFRTIIYLIQSREKCCCQSCINMLIIIGGNVAVRYCNIINIEPFKKGVKSVTDPSKGNISTTIVIINYH